jgi:hypothetical protein
VRMSERNFEVSYVCFAITELLVSFLYDLSASQRVNVSSRLNVPKASPTHPMHKLQFCLQRLLRSQRLLHGWHAEPRRRGADEKRIRTVPGSS